MINPILAWVVEHYHWQLSLLAGAGIIAVSVIGGRLFSLVSTIREAEQLNRTAFQKKMEKPVYAANQKWNRKWGAIYTAVIFLVVLPFCLTAAPQSWWRLPRDVFVILMVYDFFYYSMHRFLFHNNGFMGGPLVWVHAVHHQQLNPCRNDSSYIHPIEVACGLGLYVACIFVLSRFMGEFSVATLIITWVAFSQINLHNHDLWTSDHFPFKYLKYMSDTHHYHHARFTGGNYATISLLYDWMFGTLDHGQGWGKQRRA